MGRHPDKRTHGGKWSADVANRETPVTSWLVAWREGSAEAEGQLFEALQTELRRIAAARLRQERPGHTLQPTALVNEAYVRLVGQSDVHWANRAHFLAIAAREMRRILVDHARRRRADKRGDRVVGALTISDVAGPRPDAEIEVLALHEALEVLAAKDADLAALIELRYFAGLTVKEICEVRGVSATTVKRQLSFGVLWLKRRLRQHKRPA
jgi:RNA polymerase sigma factor (TIGR02999 family)